MRIKKLIALTLTAALMTVAIGCGAKTENGGSSDAGEDSKGNLIGVAMPTQSLQRWNQDGSNMKSELEGKGYTVDLQYANNDVNTQVQQIENMITKGCNILVIASIDGSALTDVLSKAADNNIKVIA